ncbi:MAG: 50S ribosomal protein L25 [Patescibacteria group bacterium]
MKKHILSAQKRNLFGHKVKKLRAQGLIPATVYGKKIKSQPLTVSQADFLKVYQAAGETGLVELKTNGEMRPVLIHHVQIDPVNDRTLHIEFFQVDLKEKVRTRVPLEFVGESAAVAQKQGVLLTVLDEAEVEALPSDLPEKIRVDIAQLAQVDQELKAGELKIPSGVTLLTDRNLTVVKIGPLITKEAEAEAAAEAAAAAAAAVEEAAEAAPAVPPEGEEKPEKAPPAPPQEKPAEEK